jgi:hypothetical protein
MEQELEFTELHEIRLIETIPGHWMIKESTNDSVFPPTIKPTTKEMVARVAQIVGLKEPTEPQNYPEEHCIGEVKLEERPFCRHCQCYHSTDQACMMPIGG